jgi:hypothetical protein
MELGVLGSDTQDLEVGSGVALGILVSLALDLKV